MKDIHLSLEQHRMLLDVADASGRLSIRSLPDAQMAHAIFVALSLHRLGLVAEPVIHKIRQRDADVVEEIAVAITDEGRKFLAGS